MLPEPGSMLPTDLLGMLPTDLSGMLPALASMLLGISMLPTS
jgi:hypothetical protein